MPREAASAKAAEHLLSVADWRTRALNTLTILTAAAASLVAGYLVWLAFTEPGRGIITVFFVLFWGLVLASAIFRRIRFNVRMWTFLLSWYAAGALAIFDFGPLANGPLALLALPVIALMLGGRRVGTVFAVIDTLTFIAVGAAAQLEWLTLPGEPYPLMSWVHAIGVFLVALAVLMALQRSLSRAQETSIESIRRLYDESEGLRAFNDNIVQNMEEGILLTDAAGQVIFANPAAARQLGTTVEALRGRPWASLVAPECAATIEQESAKHTQGIATRYEATLLTQGGERVPVLVSAHPTFRDSRFDGVVSVFVDIRARKEVERVHRENAEMLRAILDASQESVFLIDDQLTILTASQMAERRLNRDKGVQGLGPREFLAHGIMSPDLVESRAAAIREVFQSGQPRHFEDERDGNVFDTQVYPVFDAQGRASRAVVFGRDITVRRRAEQQTLQTERLAAMGYLAAALAHEVNNPLQGMRTNLELALDFDLSPSEHRERLGVVLRETEHLAKITKGMLEFAQPTEDTHYPVSLAYLVQQALLLTDKQMQHARVRVTTDLPEELPILQVSPTQIGQVLLNLIINAIEAMPDGGHLHIAGRAAENAVEITVTDNGPGLPPEYLKHLFEPFFTTKSSGSGLGLPISHSIVQQHGGMLSAENAQGGRGVTFTIRLPVGPLATTQEVAA